MVKIYECKFRKFTSVNFLHRNEAGIVIREENASQIHFNTSVGLNSKIRTYKTAIDTNNSLV